MLPTDQTARRAGHRSARGTSPPSELSMSCDAAPCQAQVRAETRYAIACVHAMLLGHGYVNGGGPGSSIESPACLLAGPGYPRSERSDEKSRVTGDC